MASGRTVEISLALYPDAQLAAVYGLTDLFGIASRFAAKRHPQDKALLRVSHWAAEETGKSPVRVFDTEPRAGGTPAVLILPPSLGQPLTAEKAGPFTDWLRGHHGTGATLGSVCAGAFLLGETGLLAGRTVTTHWAHAELFRTRFPEVHLDIDRLIIDDGDIITVGGVMAWTDLGLKLVDRFLGPTIMIETARLLLVDPPGREQRYYSVFTPRLMHGDAAVLTVQHWLQATNARDMTLATLAAQAGLEERTFLRRFRKATGVTATEYCQRIRVAKACKILQFNALPVERVAWDVGYGDAGAFRKVFTRIIGLTPTEYRRRFTT